MSGNIEDYYLTPYELGYGSFVKFDHDFVGREALQKMVKDGRPQRKKVTFEWNGEDLGKVFTSLFDRSSEPCRFFDLPIANYASSSYDSVTWVAGLSASPCSRATVTTNAVVCRWAWSMQTSRKGTS